MDVCCSLAEKTIGSIAMRLGMSIARRSRIINEILFKYKHNHDIVSYTRKIKRPSEL